MDEVKEHFNDRMVPSIVCLQKSAVGKTKLNKPVPMGNPSETVVDCVSQLVSLVDMIPDKAEVWFEVTISVVLFYPCCMQFMSLHITVRQ